MENIETAKELGIKTVLFNKDGVEYGGMIVNNFLELRMFLNCEMRSTI